MAGGTVSPDAIDRYAQQPSGAPRPDGGQAPLVETRDEEAARTREANLPRQPQFVESGSKEKKIDLDEDTRDALSERLSKRKQIAEELNQAGRPLTEIDRMLLRLSPDSLASFDAGEITRENLSLAWFVLHDEILQKSLAASKLMRDVPGRFHNLRNFPFIRFLAQQPRTELVDIEKRFSTEYTRKIGFSEQNPDWTPERIEAHLQGLNQLRLDVEQTLWRNWRDPLYDDISTSIYPSDMARGSRLRLHQEVVNQLSGPDGVLQRYGGKTFLELEQQDPVAAMQALYEANQRGLTVWLDKAGKEILSETPPGVDFNRIEAHAKKLEEKPKPEDVTPLQGEATKKGQELNELQNRLSQLKPRLETARSSLPDAQTEFKTKKDIYTEQDTQLRDEITDLDTKIGDRIALLPPALPPGATPAQVTSHADSTAKIMQAVSSLEQMRSARQEARKKVYSDYATVNRKFEQKKAEIKKLEKEVEDLEKAGGPIETKKAEKKTADDALKAKQDEIEKGSPEKVEQAKALRLWAKAGPKVGDILNARAGRGRENRYTREDLSNTNATADGQIQGAERLRELIFSSFYANTPEEGVTVYDPVLARKMLSDEAIARAIIYIYQVDTGQTIDIGGTQTRLADALANIDTNRNLLANPPAPLRPRRQAALERQLRQSRASVLKAVLPRIKGSEFQTNDLIRFIVHNGADATQYGNPFLQLDQRFAETAPALQLEAESIYRPGNGRTSMQEHYVTWDGDIVEDDLLSRYFGTSLPLHYRIRQNFNRDTVMARTEVEVDQRFLDILPDSVAGLPPLQPALDAEVRRIFYDANGNLRTEIRARDRLELARMIQTADPTLPFLNIPRWLPVDAHTFRDLFQNLAEQQVFNAVDTNIAANLSQRLAASAADYILHRSRPERQRLLRGMPTVIPVNNVPRLAGPLGPEPPHNFRIDYDNNGDFRIADVTDPNNPQVHLPINEYFQRRLEEYRQALGGVQTPTPEQRAQLQQEFLPILQAIGKQILIAQQMR